MAVPKKKTSRSRRDRRRSQHDRVAIPAISTCRECGAPTRSHQVCPSCGTYRGRQVVEVEEETAETESAK